jgi:hypothetical protein
LVGRLTPAIRAMNIFLLAPQGSGHPTTPSQSVSPFQQKNGARTEAPPVTGETG